MRRPGPRFHLPAGPDQVASRRLPFLTRRILLWGTLYGLAVYVVMNYVVVPLSAAPLKPPAGPAMVNGLLIHVLGVGLPSAWFARQAVAKP